MCCARLDQVRGALAGLSTSKVELLGFKFVLCVVRSAACPLDDVLPFCYAWRAPLIHLRQPAVDRLSLFELFGTPFFAAGGVLSCWIIFCRVHWSFATDRGFARSFCLHCLKRRAVGKRLQGFRSACTMTFGLFIGSPLFTIISRMSTTQPFELDVIHNRLRTLTKTPLVLKSPFKRKSASSLLPLPLSFLIPFVTCRVPTSQPQLNRLHHHVSSTSSIKHPLTPPS